MSGCVIAEYDSIDDAKIGLEVLQKSNVNFEYVSFVSSTSDPAFERLDQLPSDTIAGSDKSVPGGRAVGLGMLLGGSVATPLAVGTMLGPFLVAGPLVGMAMGAAVGGALQGAHEYGVEADVSESYEDRVRAGSVLIVIIDDDDVDLHEAKKALETTDPTTLQEFATPESDDDED